MSSNTSNDVAPVASKLSIDTLGATKPKPKKQEVAESWEDEELSPDGEGSKPIPSDDGTSAPPPTPATPIQGQEAISPTVPTGSFHTISNSLSPTARPEKTDAVARRMIAAGLGLRAPKQTEEQKAYDKAVREKERKRREEERAVQRRKEEEAAKAKAAIWDD